MLKLMELTEGAETNSDGKTARMRNPIAEYKWNSM